MMGKEQELLDAARSGNIAVVEKILSHRVKKSGPLASLRRCPGPNTTDSCGYTCLHHAALNGHKDIVELLLTHDANPNIVDNKGSTALHLAAWTGDYEIVNMLLTQSSHVPNVNLKNNDFETALHCAAQYGHTSVVSLLLQKGSDPMCRNVKDESALDLAAQYGRTDTVELILRTRPSLVRHLTAKHSPLHLASRNGHKNVVKLLIDAKFDVNYCTETGSALHEAALFGKIEVVKLLLNSGVDIELEDYQKRTVLDLLNDLNTIIAKQTKKLIREHSTLVNTDLDDSSTLMSDSSSHCISPPPGYTDNTPEHHYNDQTLTDGIASPAMTSASEFSFYEAPPPPRLSIRSSTGSEDYKPSKARLSRSRDSILDGYSTSSSRSPSYLDYELPPPLPPRHFSNRDSQISESNSNNLYEIPPIPIAINCNDDYGSLRRNVINYELEIRPESQSSLCSSNSGYGRIGEKPIPPAKPPRKSISPVNRSYNCNNYDYNHQTGNENTLKTTKNDRNCDKSSANKSHTSEHTLNPFSTFKGDSRRRLIEESDFSLLYDQIANGSAVNSSSLNRPTFRAPHLTSHTRSKSEHQPLFFVDISDNLNSSSTKPNYSNSNSNLLKKTKRATVQIPINSDSNNHYNGQRTPDYEPPSPTTAANGIQAIINPLCLSDETNSSDDDYTQSSNYYCTSDSHYFNCSHISNNNAINDDCDDDIPVFFSITPLEYKRLSSKPSRDIETLTEEELFATLDSSGYVRLSFRKPVNDNNKVIKKSVAVSTDNQIPVVVNNNSAKNKKNIFNNYCETLKLDRSGEKENPFAGLCRGSVVSNIPSVKRRDITDGRKSLRRQRNFNCDNNIYSTLKRNKNKKSKSMDSSDKSRTRNVKNASVDDCLGVGNHKSGHEERKSDNISLLSGSPFDENAEWAEIANIMASFGSGIGRESLFNSEMENSFTSCLSKDSSSTDFEDQTVEEWLTRIGLSEYANLLIVNGFDNILYMGSNVMDDSDLLEIGVTNASHRDKMLLEAKTLPKVKLLTKSDEVLTVEEWLESLKLTEYRNSFRSNGYNEMSRVRNLWEVELNTVLEINKLGHRKRILASLGERLRLIEDLGLDDLDFDKLNLNISQLSVEEVLDNSMKTIDNKEEEPKIQRNSMTNPQLASDMDKIQTNQSSTQWKHTNKELIDSSCKYTANYLGSTLVRELRGIDSTRASIQKLKSSTKDIAKIPKIILSISYTGVQFIDAQTQQLVCEHEIRNIHCICQDSEDLNHFAYITKELETNNNYCHVFSAQNTDLVTEVILTLGQAFEIAYQMVLESDKCPKDMNVTNANINTSNNVDKSQSHNSINFNNPQNNNNNNSNNNNNNNNSIKTNINNNTEITNKKDDNKENVKSTYITTINITTTDQKINSKVNEKVCQISSQTGQSSSNSVTNEEPKSSKPSTITTTTTISTKPIPPSGKPSPPVTTKSGQRPTPSPKPSTIPKPVTRTKPVLPFKPQILAKPTTK